MRRFLAWFPVVLCSLAAQAEEPSDASFVRIVKVGAEAHGDVQAYVGTIENRLDAPLAGLTLAVRFVRQTDVPVVKFVELDDRPSALGTSMFSVVPGEVAPELDPSTLAGVGVTVASYAVAPELEVLRRMVRDGTDLDVLSAVRSCGLDGREAGTAVPDRLLFAVRDAAGEDEAIEGPSSGLWAALVGRLLVREGHEEDLARISTLLADAERAVPPDVVSRAMSRPERAGVLSLLGAPGTLAGALGRELRRRPGEAPLATWLAGVGRRPPEEQPGLLSIAAAAWPRVADADRVLGDRAGVSALLEKLVPDAWVAGLWLSLDLEGDAEATKVLGALEPVLLLPWTIVQEGAFDARAKVQLGERGAGVPESVRALLTEDPAPTLDALRQRIRLADRTLLAELWPRQEWLARHGLGLTDAFARAVAMPLGEDATMHALTWPLVESFVRLADPDDAAMDGALAFLAPRLVEGTEPWSALEALALLEPLADSPTRRGSLARAYELIAGSRDEAVAKAATKRRDGLGAVVMAPAPEAPSEDRLSNWLIVIAGIIAAGYYAYWRRR